jgi:hypothetical protein
MDLSNRKTVEEYLDVVDYSWTGYIPTLDALKFTTFIQELNGGGDENKTPIVHTAMMEKVFNQKKRSMVLCHRGLAKAVTLDTKLLTPEGFVYMKDAKVGDTLFDRNGVVTSITHKSEIFYKDTYRLLLTDGRSVDVSEDHINIVEKRVTGKRRLCDWKEYNITTKDILSKGVHYNRKVSDRNPRGLETKWFIPTSSLVSFSKSDVPLDPYIVGCILGDGSIDKTTGFTRFHTHIDDVDEFRQYMGVINLGPIKSDKRRPDTVRYSLKGIGKVVKSFIGTENVYKKRVPKELMYSSSLQRYAVLQGLMDTDGTVDINGYSSFTSVSKGLANDVASIVRSLGGEASITENNWDNKVSYRVQVKTNHNCFRLERKAKRWSIKVKGRIGVSSITKIDMAPTQCISVDSWTKSFQVNEYITTHNTTLFAEYLFLHIAAFGYMPGFGDVNLILYVTDSIENGVKNLRRNIEHRYSESEMMQQMVPNRKISVGSDGAGFVDVSSEDGMEEMDKQISSGRKFTDIRLEFKNHKGHTTIIKGYGAKTGVRGSKELGRRPQLVVFDDILSDTDAQSPTIIANIENTVYKAVSKAMDPKRSKQIWLGTPFNQNDPIYKAAESGVWEMAVFPVAQEFDSTTTREEFKGSWEDRFDYDYVKDEFDSAMALGRPSDFYQELMLRISSEEDRLIPDTDLVWYNRNSIMGKRDSLHYYITTDMATTDSTSADFSVIMVWGVNSNSDILLVDYWFGKVLLNESINNLFRLARTWKTNLLGVGIEVSGQQGGFISTITDKMMRENNYFPLASYGNNNKMGIRPATGVQKYARFLQIQPKFATKKIWLPENSKDDPFMIELINELKNVGRTNTGRKIGKSKNDDILDTIAMLTMLELISPSDTGEVTLSEGESDNSMWFNYTEDKDEYKNSIVF